MFLKSLKLTNFRNYQVFEHEFKKPITILLGNNAQGKSNLLESIYFLATTKSHKADQDFELIYSKEETCRVEGEVMDLESKKLEIILHKPENYLVKRVKVNALPKKILDYIGNLHVVSFLPEDINLVQGPPALRRWHIDITLAQINKAYKKALTEYGDVIVRKNRILKNIKEGFSKVEELDFWINKQLELGRQITSIRTDFFEYLNNVEKKFGTFFFEYSPSLLTKERLLEYQNREIASASSLIGPHRDDFKFLDNAPDSEPRNLAQFGSRGEQRTAVLDLKISEVEYIENFSKSRPVLLLDDVFSELDLLHRKHVLDLIDLQQTIIAAVELDSHLDEYFKKKAEILRIESGKVIF